jgi:pSer/pThr/pTyr-binding forkhead associated (FHA) protein
MKGELMNNQLDKLEERLRALIEGGLLNYLPNKVAQELASTMRENLNGQLAPHAYTLVAHPDIIAKWKNDLALVENLKQTLKNVATETGLEFAEPLSFSLAPDPQLASEEIKILISQQIEKIAETRDMESQKIEKTENVPSNAFLIIHGTKVFPLTKSVIDIGRRMENDLVIDDPRVSRDHAQLRVKNGRFVIFDLNSTGGTYVNSQRSHQSVLYPGDVISLAGVPLIYGQDNPPHRTDLKETSPLGSPASSDRQTAILRDTAQLEDKPEE